MDSGSPALPTSPAALVVQYEPLPLQQPRVQSGLPTAVSIVDAWTPSLNLTEPQRQRALAAVEIWLGQLDQAHQRVQYASDPDGMYWHAIVHRLEGDFDNALYWARRIGEHPVHHRIVDRLSTTALQDPELHRVIDQGRLQPLAWIDACRRIIQTPKKAKVKAETLLEIGIAEWQALAELALA